MFVPIPIHRGLRATSRGVNVLDSVLPELMQGLQL